MAWAADIPALTNTIAADVPKIELNFQCLNDRFAFGTIWVPAGAMIPTITNGATLGITEYATQDIMLEYYSFIKATEQYVAFNLLMPEDYNNSTIKAKFYWTGASGCTAGDTVEWEIGGVTLPNDGSIDVAIGTQQVITDTVLAGLNGDMHITASTPATTLNGTPALGELAHFKVSRNIGGTDDMSEAAWLFGVLIQYGRTNAAVATW